MIEYYETQNLACGWQWWRLVFAVAIAQLAVHHGQDIRDALSGRADRLFSAMRGRRSRSAAGHDRRFLLKRVAFAPLPIEAPTLRPANSSQFWK